MKKLEIFFLQNRNITFNNLEPIGYYYGAPHISITGALIMHFSGVTFENK